MKFYGQLEKAGLEVLASDPVTNLFEGRIYYSSALDQIRVYDGSAWGSITGGGGAGGLTPESKSASFSTSSGKNYLVDTSAGAVTATLGTGGASAQIRFSDAEQTWATYNLTITPYSGQKIMGLSINESLICDVSGAWVELTWCATNSWWVPISNGAVNAAAVEYASNNSTWDSSDTAAASAITGSSGSAMGGALTSSRTKRVRFATPIAATDDLTIEVSDNQITWIPASMGTVNAGIQIIQGLNGASTATSGIWLQKTSTSTDVDVVFGRYIYIANDDAPLGDWPSSNAYWRVRKTSGRSVSYPEATSTTSGLISAGTQTVGGIKTFQDTPSFQAHRGSNQTGPTNSSVTVVFDAEDHDTGSNYNNSTGIFTAPVAGRYLFTTGVVLDGIPAGSNAIGELHKNGVVLTQLYIELGSTGQGRKTIVGSVVVSAAAGDQFKVVLITDLAGATTILSGSGRSYFSGVKVA